MTEAPIAVIADVISSRSYADRERVQREVEDLLSAATETVAPLQPFRATVGDELQAVFSSLSDALRVTLYAGLLAPEEGAQMRFGLGRGVVEPVGSGTSSDIQDGPGWWNAREAVERLEALQRRQQGLRSWYCVGEGAEGEALEAAVNAYLLARDQLVAGMGVRGRSYARGVLAGHSQRRIAEEHGVSQPAVSKMLRDSGAQALLEGARLFSWSG